MKKIIALLFTIVCFCSFAQANRVFVTAHDLAYTTFYEGRGYYVWEVDGGAQYVQTMVNDGIIGAGPILYDAPTSTNETRCYQVHVRTKGLGAGRWVIYKFNPITEAFEWIGYDSTMDCFVFVDDETQPDRFYDIVWDYRL